MESSYLAQIATQFANEAALVNTVGFSDPQKPGTIFAENGVRNAFLTDEARREAEEMCSPEFVPAAWEQWRERINGWAGGIDTYHEIHRIAREIPADMLVENVEPRRWWKADPDLRPRPDPPGAALPQACALPDPAVALTLHRRARRAHLGEFPSAQTRVKSDAGVDHGSSAIWQAWLPAIPGCCPGAAQPEAVLDRQPPHPAAVACSCWSFARSGCSTVSRADGDVLHLHGNRDDHLRRGDPPLRLQRAGAVVDDAAALPVPSADLDRLRLQREAARASFVRRGARHDAAGGQLAMSFLDAILWYVMAVVVMVVATAADRQLGREFPAAAGHDDVMRWWFYICVPIAWLILYARVLENLLPKMCASTTPGRNSA
jgi:hypothetical protein